MTPTEFRAALTALHLSQVWAARLFGVNERTARRWAAGEQDIPRAVDLALRLLLDLPTRRRRTMIDAELARVHALPLAEQDARGQGV